MYITDMYALIVLTGQVSYRMTYNQSSYIRVRYGVYHFVRRVPADVKQHYRSDRVSISLRTKSSKAAIRSAQSISQRLDDYWHGLRLQKMDVPALHLIIDDNDDADDNSPTMDESQSPSTFRHLGCVGCLKSGCMIRGGGPRATRTPNLLFRRQMLYPIEL